MILDAGGRPIPPRERQVAAIDGRLCYIAEGFKPQAIEKFVCQVSKSHELKGARERLPICVHTYDGVPEFSVVMRAA